jgi:hypothetical protein
LWSVSSPMLFPAIMLPLQISTSTSRRTTWQRTKHSGSFRCFLPKTREADPSRRSTHRTCWCCSYLWKKAWGLETMQFTCGSVSSHMWGGASAETSLTRQLHGHSTRRWDTWCFPTIKLPLQISTSTSRSTIWQRTKLSATVLNLSFLPPKIRTRERADPSRRSTHRARIMEDVWNGNGRITDHTIIKEVSSQRRTRLTVITSQT